MLKVMYVKWNRIEKPISRRCKGALTVEACIILPFLLCFLLLIAFFIKVACINISLDQAVNETAKQIATSSYPLSFLNEMEDNIFKDDEGADNIIDTMPSFSEEKDNIAGYLKGGAVSNDVFSNLLSGNFGLSDAGTILNSVAAGVGEDTESGIRSFLINTCKGKYLNVKMKAKYLAAKFLLDKYFEGNLIDQNNVKFLLVEVPQSDREFANRNADKDLQAMYKELGYIPGKDNVVISIEYKLEIPLPFFKDKEIILRHTAVEKAWLSGGNRVYTVSDNNPQKDSNANSSDDGNSGSDSGNKGDDSKDRIVYVTDTGTKYHTSGCQYLARSKIPIKLKDAEKRGYKPCKICILGDPLFGGE